MYSIRYAPVHTIHACSTEPAGIDDDGWADTQALALDDGVEESEAKGNLDVSPVDIANGGLHDDATLNELSRFKHPKVFAWPRDSPWRSWAAGGYA